MLPFNYPRYEEAKEAAIKLSKETKPLGIYIKENPYQYGYILTHFAEYDDQPCAICGNWVDWAEEDFPKDNPIYFD